MTGGTHPRCEGDGHPAGVLTRRQFLRQGAAAAVALAPIACSEVVGPESGTGTLVRRGPPLRVVVVGAGLAGLVSAYELSLAGHDVTVLEARSEVGGRVRTVRSPFSSGHYVEQGAARIPRTHSITLGYAAHFGLDLDPFYPRLGDYVLYENGVRTRVPPGAFLQNRPEFLKIRDGSEHLPNAFARALGGRIRLGAVAVRIEQTATSVSVVYSEGSAQRTITGDHLICTVPYPVMSRIEFVPALSPTKHRAIRTLSYQDSTRVAVEFGTRFWEADGYNGFANTDLPDETWHPSWERAGPRGVLQSYIRGPRATELGAYSEEERVRRILAHWSNVFPGTPQRAEASVSISWKLDPWAGGAYAAPSAAQAAEIGAAVRASEGRIHFAGEHASDWNGWMQGALSSGLNAAVTVNDSPVSRSAILAMAFGG